MTVPTIQFSLCLHIHQPVGNFDHVIAEACDRCYSPLLETLSRHGTPSGLHISGCLLDWIGANRPRWLQRLSEYLEDTGSELLTSGYYEPILPVLREDDACRQIRQYSARLSELGGGTPKGLWLTERVWEPGLPRLLQRAGVEWVVVDDRHLVAAGTDSRDAWRPALTENGGHTVVLLPGSKRLRYLIPFHDVEEVVDELDRMRGDGAGLAFYGDDGEKFGVWPGTHDLCYRRGWLDAFLEALSEAEWIETVPPSRAVADARPAGPVYVPTASYREMGEWTLPVAERRRQRSLVEEHGEELSRHLREGFWRVFLSRYPESGELHKLGLYLEPAVRESGDRDACMSLWRSQCNCSYWHGVFGGIYLPHLREAVWTELMRAAAALRPADPEAVDIDRDGRPELLLLGAEMLALVRPEQGLSCTALGWMGGDVPRPVGHVLSRRIEAYHDLVRDPDGDDGDGARTIHSEMEALEPGLAGLITEDSWRRSQLSDLLLPPQATVEEWASGDGCIGHFQDADCSWSHTVEGRRTRVTATMESGGAEVKKTLLLDAGEGTIRAESFLTGGRPDWLMGVEVCLNMLTGSSPDRFISIGGGRRRKLGESGREAAAPVLVGDLWRGVAVEIEAAGAEEVWFAPLYSVSRSERGYEKVFQGSAVMPAARVGADGSCSMTLSLRLRGADG